MIIAMYAKQKNDSYGMHKGALVWLIRPHWAGSLIFVLLL
jgi:hypothetical protein